MQQDILASECTDKKKKCLKSIFRPISYSPAMYRRVWEWQNSFESRLCLLLASYQRILWFCMCILKLYRSSVIKIWPLFLPTNVGVYCGKRFMASNFLKFCSLRLTQFFIASIFCFVLNFSFLFSILWKVRPWPLVWKFSHLKIEFIYESYKNSCWRLFNELCKSNLLQLVDAAWRINAEILATETSSLVVISANKDNWMWLLYIVGLQLSLQPLT